MTKKLISLLLTSYFLLLAGGSIANSAGSDTDPPDTSGFAQISSQIPTSLDLGINLTATNEPEQLQALTTINQKLPEDTARFPITIPITTTTPLTHLTNLSLNSSKLTTTLHILDITPTTPTKDLNLLAINLNNPKVSWTTKPILIFGRQPQITQTSGSFFTPSFPDVNDQDQPTQVLGEEDETASTYQDLFTSFSTDLNTDKYTLIPAEILLRSISPTPADWIESIQNLYDASPAIALYANHYTPGSDQTKINEIIELLPDKNLYFFSTFNYSASSSYSNQVRLLSDFSLPEGITFTNTSVPSHCQNQGLLFYLQANLFTSTGATPTECQLFLSLIQPEGVGVQSLSVLISSIFTLAIVVATIFVFFMLILGGYGWITAGGDKEKVEGARSRITNAIIGLAIVAAAWALIQIIARFFGIDISNIELPSAAPPKL